MVFLYKEVEVRRGKKRGRTDDAAGGGLVAVEKPGAPAPSVADRISAQVKESPEDLIKTVEVHPGAKVPTLANYIIATYILPLFEHPTSIGAEDLLRIQAGSLDASSRVCAVCEVISRTMQKKYPQLACHLHRRFDVEGLTPPFENLDRRQSLKLSCVFSYQP